MNFLRIHVDHNTAVDSPLDHFNFAVCKYLGSSKTSAPLAISLNWPSIWFITQLKFFLLPVLRFQTIKIYTAFRLTPAVKAPWRFKLHF